MRRLLVPALLLSLALLPAVPADTRTGASYGVDAFYASAGLWDVWLFDKAGPTSTATIRVAWNNTTPLRGADYDLTLWKPGALNDGALRANEVIAWSWTHSTQVREEQIVISLAPATYVITVEAIQAQGEVFTLSADPGTLRHSNPPAPGVKIG